MLAAATIAVWIGGVAYAQVGDFISPGPLAQAHAHLSGITQCTQCHAPVLGAVPERCLACHDEIAAQVDAESGFHARKGAGCIGCHPDHRGRDVPLSRIDTDRFDHREQTGFALVGGHRGLECAACHDVDSFGDVQRTCAACHDTPHVEEQGARELLSDCADCHSDERWVPAHSDTLDHTDLAQVDFALRGAHTEVDCVGCHIDAVIVPTEHDACTTCHDDPHRAPFSDPCTDCHAEASWRVQPFDHDQTGFALQGVHTDVACVSCHPRSAVEPLEHGACADCHRDPHRGQFSPQPCNACHSVRLAGFALSDFDHDTTAVPLTDLHAEVACADCHGEGHAATFVGLPHGDCDSCHDDVHDRRFEPTPCAECHTPAGWAVGSFDHDLAQFPLRGAHQQVECEECHGEGVYQGLPHDTCAACHEPEPHGEPPPEPCAGCHTESGWLEVHFAHTRRTAFALEPQHTETPCTSCHPSVQDFSGAQHACEACHQRTRPLGHYAGACEGCHEGAGWLPADLGGLDHAATGFALAGAHSILGCVDCHDSGVFGDVDGACVGCHAADDPHRGMLGVSCGDCHTSTAWFRTRFRHYQTGWPLRGAHRLAACVDCHAVSYAGTPSDCRGCHQSSAPLDVVAHQGALFTDCAACHRPFTWAALSVGLR